MAISFVKEFFGRLRMAFGPRYRCPKDFRRNVFYLDNADKFSLLKATLRPPRHWRRSSTYTSLIGMFT